MSAEARELMQLIADGGASIFWLTETQARAKRMERLERAGRIVRRKDDARDVYPWCVFEVPGVRVACYHARANRERWGQRVLMLMGARRGTHPRNVRSNFVTARKWLQVLGACGGSAISTVWLRLSHLSEPNSDRSWRK